MKCFLGCSGWFYWHWRGLFYPEQLPQNKWFKHYTNTFNTVELNSTFYRFPKISTAKSWYRQSPSGFVYTLKANRLITHVKKFKNCNQIIKEFYKVGDEIKEKMGCFLFQLPPSLKYTKAKLKGIICQLDLERKNVLEFRHPTWFTEEVYDIMKEEGIIFCSVSAPGLPDKLVKTAKDVYIRFHGKDSWYSHNYTKEELECWKKRIEAAKPENVWAYFNNDANAYAPFNALTLRKLLC